jgi:transaldolase
MTEAFSNNMQQMQQELERHKYTNDVLKKGIRSFQKHIDDLRNKLESN